MRVLLDTNVIIDVLLDREPFVHDSRRLWVAAIVTRNPQDFQNAPIQVYTPVELLHVLGR